MPQRERLSSSDFLGPLALFIGALVISQFAFSKSSRMKIGERDGWACQASGCKKTFAKGWMVDAAHSPDHHDPEDPLYDDPSAGDIRCLDHHQAQHEEGTALGPEGDQGSINLLSGRDRRTWEWRAKHPNAW